MIQALKYQYQYLKYSILKHRKNRNFDTYDHVTVYFEVIKQNDELSNNVHQQNHIQITVDRFVADNHDNQNLIETILILG